MDCVRKSRFSDANVVKRENPIFFSITLQIAKNRSKQATTLIFFPEKAESPYFTNLEKGGQKGGQGKANFSLKLLVKMKKNRFWMGISN